MMRFRHLPSLGKVFGRRISRLNNGVLISLNAFLAMSPNQEEAMSRNNPFTTLSVALLVMVVLVVAPGTWAQSNYQTLHKFSGGADGSGPFAGLILDSAGNLYGTTGGGGAHRDGIVFMLTPNADGSWKEKVLHSFAFNHKDGIGPGASLILDQAGNLYGTTGGGGTSDFGTVFELTPNPDGSWTEKVLYSFAGGTDGAYPQGGVVMDAGNLYGNTLIGGSGSGVVFKLTPKANGRWSEDVIYVFGGGSDGIGPTGTLVFDAAGNLYGTTNGGGTDRFGGTVFQLTPNQGGGWSESVLHSFTGKDGLNPLAGVILDQAGNLYGTTGGGGAFGSGGVAFTLTKNQDGSWKEKVLHSFRVGQPYAALTFDGVGNLYGTTRFGGAGYGVVFKLSPNSNGGWQETILHKFFDHPGAESYANVIFDAAQNLYGTTGGDGESKTFGSVFKITP
jgi:uncharacterized repeat protein (TIGR03803 family)